MLNIISYFENTLKIEEKIKYNGYTLIPILQKIMIKKYGDILGYNYKHPDGDEIKIFINDLSILKKVVEDVLSIINNIRNNTKKIEIDDNNLILYFKNTNKELINSIRIILMSEIETFAFDNVEIINNSTFIPDEVWKQRIELIPIKKLNENYNNDENNYFELYKEYDNEYSNYITSNDLITKNDNIKLVYDDIIINKLNFNQKINIRAYYKKGTGNDNFKWCPVKNIPFRIIWEFYIKKKDIDKIIPNYISYNINIIEDENGISVQTTNKECKNTLKKINDNNNFKNKIIYSKIIRMKIKSVGQYNSKFLFYKAIDILEIKYKDFLDKLNTFIQSEST